MLLLRTMLERRYWVFSAVIIAALLSSAALLLVPHDTPIILVIWLASCALALLGLYDVTQRRHAILRNYPIVANMRFVLESIRPELRQYFFEGDKDGAPFPRDKRAIVYQRAKKQLDKRPFGTMYDVYAPQYEWLHHSIAPKPPTPLADMRVTVGSGPRAYSASLLNISAMSYGALSGNAIRALNQGAREGGFFHDTGEGGVSPHHREFGGDLVWELGSGYFGARTASGGFDAERFAEVASDAQIKMIEVKLSQGAKPGYGGVLPASKVTAEIAAIRGVPAGVDCVSPAQHSEFSTPIELLQFIAKLRDLSGGKPTGFKLCIGHRWEFMAICKAMLATKITPDFIVIDGKEGGTGAAPLEFMDHMGMPLRDGLNFAHQALRGVGLREKVRLGASGKITSAFDMARVMAIGADWCNSARGFMFAVGCIQAQSCHTGTCPTGVATQDPARARAIDVPSKADRVTSFHRNTVIALSELVAAAGLSHPSELRGHHFLTRVAGGRVASLDQKFPQLSTKELLGAFDTTSTFGAAFTEAAAHSFARQI